MYILMLPSIYQRKVVIRTKVLLEDTNSTGMNLIAKSKTLLWAGICMYSRQDTMSPISLTGQLSI